MSQVEVGIDVENVEMGLNHGAIDDVSYLNLVN